MANTITEDDWDSLLRRIKKGKCTPFLGAGACYSYLPLGSDIAKEWAELYKYPFKDSNTDLSRVAQYLAIRRDPMFPKETIMEKFQNINHPDFNEPNEPHGLLADFRLPVYITTNYDDFMMQALKTRKAEPKREVCRWNSTLQRSKGSVFDDHSFIPSPACPVVFHLHGCIEISESLVLTEDDYLDFLVNISRNINIIPPLIQECLTNTSLLFIGYKLSDVNFRVLLRGIMEYLENSLKRQHLSVQLVPVDNTVSQEEKDKAQSYLDKYFNELDIKVYWGTSREFTKELRQRWDQFNGK